MSDHSPIYLHLSFSIVQKGRGFWRLNNDFLNEPEFIFGMNNVIERVIEPYSKNENPNNFPDQNPASRPLLIPHVLLHDILLIKSWSFTLKYAASQKEKMLRRMKELNDRIDEKANSPKEEDIATVDTLKQEVQELEDERDMAIARK